MQKVPSAMRSEAYVLHKPAEPKGLAMMSKLIKDKKADADKFDTRSEGLPMNSRTEKAAKNLKFLKDKTKDIKNKAVGNSLMAKLHDRVKEAIENANLEQK